jgi:uncharacterized protein YraI
VWYQVSTVAGVGWVNSQHTLARGDFSGVPFAEAPAILNPNTIAPGVIGAGYIPSDDTAVNLGYSTGREWGVSVIVDQNLRFQPSMNSAAIQGLGPDQSIIFTVVGATFAEDIPWVQIALPNGTVGWLEQSKVIYRPFACELSAVRFTQSVDLRSGPDGSGPSAPVYVAEGQEAYLLDRIGDAFKVELIDGSVGWAELSFLLVRDRNSVHSDYCAKGGASARGVVGTGGTGTTGNVTLPPGVALGSTPKVIINTGFLNIRSGPGAHFTSVATLPGGTELDVLGFAPDGVWYLVIGTFGQGWVNSDYVLFRGDGRHLPIIRNAVGQVATPQGVVNRPSVTLYAAPNLTLGSIGDIPAGTYDVVARTSDGLWVQLRTSLGFGWVQADFVTLAGDIGLIPVIGG